MNQAKIRETLAFVESLKRENANLRKTNEILTSDLNRLLTKTARLEEQLAQPRPGE